MATFKLPDLGEGLAEAQIVEWHVKVGDRVAVDQPMVSVETAKALVEVPAPFSGIVCALHGAAGDIVATGAALIDFDDGTVVGSLPATGGEEFIEAATIGVNRDAAPTRGRAVPTARALARHLRVDLDGLAGSGRDGLITLDDVLRSARLPTAPAAPPKLAAPAGGILQPLRGARRWMSRSMTLAREQTALSTVCDDADIQAWRQPGGYMLRLMRALVRACRAEPALNAWYDPAEDSRVIFEHIDLAVAVDTPAGLFVPVIRNVEAKSPQELAAALLAHKQAAHRRGIAPEDLRDFTLMLSNYGTLAGRYATPQVMPPAVAILGAGKVRRDAVVAGEVIEAHLCMPLSLSFDHRCVTGGEACRFLAAVIADMQAPE